MYRKEALDYRKLKWKGNALLLRGIPYWIIILLVTFFLLFFIIFIIYGTYTRRVYAIGEVTSDPRPANFYSSVQGVVVEKYVKEGDILEINAPIYKIDVSKSTSSGILNKNQQKSINNQITLLNKIINRLENNKEKSIKTLEKQKEMYIKALEHSNEIIKSTKNTVDILKGNTEEYKLYLSKGLINKEQLRDQVSTYYQQESNLYSLISQQEQNNLQLANIEGQIQTQTEEFNYQIDQIKLKRFELQKELLSIDADGEVIIHSSIEGRVESMSVTEGQMVLVGDSLLQIIPSKETIYLIILWVPNDAIAYLHKGDRIHIEYDAFPAEKFGQFGGTISVISTTPASNQEMLTYQGLPKNNFNNGEPLYKITVIPDKQFINYGGKRLNLANGMKTRCILFLEQRNIYQWMLFPFYNIANSINGEINE